MPTTRIAAYGGVSSDSQDHASQLHDVRAYVERRWPSARVTEYLDKASGGRFTRKGLDTMMTEVRKSRVEIVVVYKLDRLGRSLQHLAQLIEEFAAHGTALVSTSQGIDTSESNPAGKFTLHILAAVAEFERSNILERIKVGITAAKARGVTFGRPRSLDSHRDTVTELSRQGLSSRKIAAKLEIPPGSVFTILRQAKLAA